MYKQALKLLLVLFLLELKRKRNIGFTWFLNSLFGFHILPWSTLKRNQNDWSYVCVLENNISAFERLCRRYRQPWQHKKCLGTFCCEYALGLTLLWLKSCMRQKHFYVTFEATQGAKPYTRVCLFFWGLLRKNKFACPWRRKTLLFGYKTTFHWRRYDWFSGWFQYPSPAFLATWSRECNVQ
jgi:hypothetical protein